MEHHLYRAPPLEPQLAGEQPVGDAAERVEVDAMIGLGRAEHHFGRHERGGAAGAAVLGEVDGVVVRSAGGVELTRPKSSTLAKSKVVPARLTTTLAGLMSRCTRPF